MLLLFPLSVALAGGIDVDASLDEATRLVERDHPEVARDLLWQTAWDEDGRTDPRVWAALSEACVAAADHGCAVEATEQALTWSHTEDQAAVATERLAWLIDGFGTVLLSGAEGGLVAQVSLAAEPSGEAEAGWVRVLSDRLEAGVVLPERVAVPVGEVTVGGEPVRIEPGSSHTVPIDAPRRALQGTELQLSSGMQVRLAGPCPPWRPL